MRNLDAVLLCYEIDLAVGEIVTFGKAKSAEINERKRRLIKIRSDLVDRNEIGQLELFDRSESVAPEVEKIILNPTAGW